MTLQDILRHRLHNEQLTKTKFSKPEEVVSYLGAVQSQDYSGAKWALAQRLPHATDESLEKAFNEGKFLRTHVMRPTWHFVAPQDIRWMLPLTASRVSKVMSSYNKLLELTPEVFAKTQKVIIHLLQENKQLTRQEIKAELTRIGITTNVQRLAHIVMQAELDGIICSGPRKGKQFTYMLLDERVPKAKSLLHDEALAELTRRYFTSHGPATIKDFAWWSGLTVADVKLGIEMNKKLVLHENVDEKEYWFVEAKPIEFSEEVHLLPNYDEYTIAYKDRDAYFNPKYAEELSLRQNSIFQHTIIYQGKIIGLWHRVLKKNEVVVDYKFFKNPTDAQFKAFKKAAKKYADFLGLLLIIKD